MRLLLLLFFAFILMLSKGGAQDTSWTLQRCVDHAIQHNLQVKQSEITVSQNKLAQDQSYASFIPTINGQVGHNYYWGRAIDPYTNQFTNQQVQSSNFGLSSTLTVFEGLQLQRTLSQSKLNYLASRKDLEKIRNDISLNVVAAYLQVLYNQDLVDVFKAQVAATDDQCRRMRRMFELGSASKANYLDLEAQLASDSASLVAGMAQVDQSVLILAQLLELESVKGFDIDRPMMDEPPALPAGLSADAVYSAALLTQPEIKGNEFRLKAAENGLAAARGSRMPRLYMSGSLNTTFSTSFKTPQFGNGYGYDAAGFTSSFDTVFLVSPNITGYEMVPFWDQLDRNRGAGVGFMLQLPLFNGWSARTNVERARLALQQSKLNDEITKNNLYKSVQQAVLDAVSSRRKYESTTRSVESLQESANFNKQRFELGLINTYEYSLSRNNLARAQADRLQAKYDHIFRLKILDFYQGRPLAF
ncbi:MAG: TolC family protein [Bacteroidota bacterium]